MKRLIAAAAITIAGVSGFVAGGLGMRSQLGANAATDISPALHYAPAENLERLDLAMIDQAKTSLDMAAYVLTDWPIIQAITRAADRGVKVRLYLDGGQLAERAPPAVFQDLAITPEVEIRVKPASKPPMHLKGYQIDGRLLRTGSANLSASGEKQQDNDIVVIESVAAAQKFMQNFEIIWVNGQIYR